MPRNERNDSNCPVCGRAFVPNADNAPGSLVYCSPRCAWNTDDSRSTESLVAEHNALVAAIAKTEAPRRVAIVGCRPPPGNQMANVSYLELLREVQVFVRNLPAGTVVVSGGAAGVDSQAAADARGCGLQVVEFLPDYAKNGSAAPLMRNSLIVRDADEVHAWPAPWSRGTWDTVRKARAAGKPCTVHEACGAYTDEDLAELDRRRASSPRLSREEHLVPPAERKR